MNLGSDTVTFRTFTPGSADRLGVRSLVPTNFDVTGCSMQQVSHTEKVTETDVAVEVWHCISPPAAAAVNMTTTGELAFNGRTYQVTGVRPYGDLGGNIHHVTVACEFQAG